MKKTHFFTSLFVLLFTSSQLMAQVPVEKPACKMIKEFENGEMVTEMFYNDEGIITAFKEYQDGTMTLHLEATVYADHGVVESGVRKDAEGNLIGGFAFTFDEHDLVVKREFFRLDADGNQILVGGATYTNDPSGDCIMQQITAYDGQHETQRISAISYTDNLCNNTTTIVDPAGEILSTEQWTYDKMNGYNFMDPFHYTSRHNLLAKKVLDVNGDVSEESFETISIEYNDQGFPTNWVLQYADGRELTRTYEIQCD